MGKYQYTLKSTGANSQKYGACEICGKYCSDVFMISESREYINPITGQVSFTHNGCRCLFGHEDCLNLIKLEECRGTSIKKD